MCTYNTRSSYTDNLKYEKGIQKIPSWVDVSDDISVEKKMDIFRLSSYKWLTSGFLILGINSLSCIKPMDLCYSCYKSTFFNIA